MITNLNTDQEKSLKYIVKWWGGGNGSQLYCVLDGAGGTGKTYLVNTILHTLTNCKPMLLAPTHEALKQLRDKIEGDYLFKTVHSALGISPTTDKQDLEFEHNSLPGFWDNYNLAIVDEASMLSTWLLDILKSTSCKILFIGHKSQLPPVSLTRGIMDKCISPVFEQDFPTTTLRIPMRNTGSLFDFNNHLETMIYTLDRVVPNTFDINRADLDAYLKSEEGIYDLLENRTKVVLWANESVDTWNLRLRTSIFKGTDLSNPDNMYLPSDKIILTAPLSIIPNLDRFSDMDLATIDYNSPELDRVYSNTKAEVRQSSMVTVILNNSLKIKCYKIIVESDGVVKQFFTPIDKLDLDMIADYYKHIAWKAPTKAAKIKAFKHGRFILSCFAQVKHYYAATSYRLQGCSIPNIVCINSDLARVRNIIESKKHRYVACSRTIDKLMFYRGL